MVAVVLALLLASQQPRRLVKSHAQILAMGREGWRDAVDNAGLRSRAARANGEWAFGEAAAWRNGRLLARKGRSAHRAMARDLRAFVSHAIGVGDAAGGGGTAWATVWCESHADVEEAIGAILLGRAKAANASARQVEGQMRWLRTELDRAIAEGGDFGPYARRGQPEMRELQASLTALENDARRLPPRDSTASFACCLATLAKVRDTL